MAGKWNYKTHQYDDYNLPERAALYSHDMDTVVGCASCGRSIEFGETYTSFEIHNAIGLGYAVCPLCHALEVERALQAKEAHEDSVDDVMNSSIDELGLSLRTRNCLRRAGIHTIEDLCNRRQNGIRVIRGMGNKTFEEVTDKMREIGVWFKEG